jgi:RNA polymerase sigma-70 factor, ECF subfamily
MDWSLILKRDGPAVWRTGYRILGNSADTDECFQEAMLNAMELNQKQTVNNWRALLQRLMATRAIDRLRQRYRHRTVSATTELDELPNRQPQPSQLFDDAELQQQLRAALAQIQPNQSTAFCLCCLDGWTYRECGLEMGLTAEAVGVLIQRARKKLQAILADHLELTTTTKH